MQVRNDGDRRVDDAVGPLNALEADRFVEELRSFPFEQMGGAAWLQQHEWLTQLNVQAHVNASQMRDEFVVEALVLHEKVPLLVRELIASELWKHNVYPLLKDFLSKEQSVKGYLLLYHEAVLANLLEAVLFHSAACESASELLGELCDYCHRKLIWLLQTDCAPPPRPADKEALKAQFLREAEDDYLESQHTAISMSAALFALSIGRFLTEQLPRLPLAVSAKLLDEYDMLMLLVALLEQKPWEHRGADGTLRRFVQGQWTRVGEAEARRMDKSEAQAWLSAYNMMSEGEVRRKYKITSYRKNQLLRLRAQLNETTVDQIPLLIDLQRSLDELQFIEAAPNADSKPAYVFETVPELHDSLTRGVDWKAVAKSQREGVLNESDEQKRETAQKLAALFDADGIDAMLAQQGSGAEPPKMRHYVEVSLSDAEGKKLATVTAASDEEMELQPQTPFTLSNEAKKTPLPLGAVNDGTFSASLNLGDNKPHVVSGQLELDETKRKQWAQLGFDPHGLRAQLHFLRAADEACFHLIHCRVTPPVKQTLSITFHSESGDSGGDGGCNGCSGHGGGGEALVVVAHGRGTAAQTAFTLADSAATARVPRACRVRARLQVGDESYETEEAPLALAAADQMVWRQLGRHAGELRVQMKLAPATGGYVVTAVRVTVPSALKHAGRAPAAAENAANGTAKNNTASRSDGSGAENDQASGVNSTAAATCTGEAVSDHAAPLEEPSQASEAASECVRERVRAIEAAEAAVAAATADVAAMSLEAKRAATAAATASDRAAKLAAALDDDDDDSPIKDVTDESDEADKAAEAAKVAKEQAAACARRLRDASARADAARAELSELKTEQVSESGVPSAPGVAVQPAHAADSAAAAARKVARAQGKTVEAALKARDGFVPCSAFQGMRQGYVFKMGTDGLGYYRDTAHALREVPVASGVAAAPKSSSSSAAADTAAAAITAAAAAAAAAAATTAADSAAPACAASETAVAPVHSVRVASASGGKTVTVVVELPGVESQRQLDVEVTATSFSLEGGGYRLCVALPCEVDTAAASAKFSAKTSKLKVTVPEA